MIAAAAGLFAPDPGYLNTASLGIPPTTALQALDAVHRRWGMGQLQPADFDQDVARARAAWAKLSNVPTAQVAVAGAVSEFVGVIAASLPDGAKVVTAHNEFTSLTFPFLAHGDRGISVSELPLAELGELQGSVELIAVSAVQSADGAVADLVAIAAAAKRTGARLLVDTTQSCGWLPVDCSDIDFVVCGGYKWLLSPRGTAYLSVRPELMDGIRSTAAGWYAGEDPWSSIYGGPLRLAQSARRYDVSPAWFCWTGAALSLEFLAGLDMNEVREHNVGLANRFQHGLGQSAGTSAIVTVDAPRAAQRLAAAGIRTAVRAGRVRASFHLYNTSQDVESAVRALKAS